MAGGVEEVGMVLLADRVAIVLIETRTMGLDVDNLELIFKISTFMSTIIIMKHELQNPWYILGCCMSYRGIIQSIRVAAHGMTSMHEGRRR